ncbi:MAG: radical SAM protein [Spirochaetes bacterium]|nr:radical SAM protein [Spirochaetota bacterium]
MHNKFFQKNNLSLILTLQCNLHCDFCPVKIKNLSLNFNTAGKAIDFFLSLPGKKKRIKFFGGEPLLEIDLLKKIVLYAESQAKKLKKEITFVLPTNGTLLSKDILTFLQDHKIDLILSIHHLIKIDKSIFNSLVHFSGICLNMDILPEKAGTLLSEFRRLYKLGFKKFNLLPAYYISWTEEELKILEQQFIKIKNFYSQHKDIQFANPGLLGEIPLYNSCYTIDPNGQLFSSNIILSKHFEQYKDLLLMGDLKTQKFNQSPIPSLKRLIQNNLDKKILKSTLQADHLLSKFINSLGNLNPVKKADIKIGYSCNNYCKFCVQGRKRDILPDMTTGEVKKILNKARRNCKGIVFTGGEPTVRPDFLELIRYTKSLGFERIQVQSNGRMFAYKKFCQASIRSGVNEFGLALHGHIPELHNYLTSSESFFETIQGFKNLKELGQPVYANTVITKSNYRHLEEIAGLLASLKVEQFQFAFVHAMGSAEEHFPSIVPRMAMVIPYVIKGLNTGIKAGIQVMTEAIPYCLMPGYERYIVEAFIPSTEIYELDMKIEFDKVRPKLAKIKGKECPKCKYDKVCEGTWREYPKHFGFSEFRPILS